MNTNKQTIKIDTTENYRQLGYDIAYQGAKDFFEASEKGKKKILKELRHPQNQFFSNGLSALLAEKLETEPEEVKKRIKRCEEERK